MLLTCINFRKGNRS